MSEKKRRKKGKGPNGLDHAGEQRKIDRARSSAPPPVVGCGRQSAGHNPVRMTPCPSPNRT